MPCAVTDIITTRHSYEESMTNGEWKKKKDDNGNISEMWDLQCCSCGNF